MLLHGKQSTRNSTQPKPFANTRTPYDVSGVTRGAKSNKLTTTSRAIAWNRKYFCKHEPDGEYHSAYIQYHLILISVQFWVSRVSASVRVGIKVRCSALQNKTKTGNKTEITIIPWHQSRIQQGLDRKAVQTVVCDLKKQYRVVVVGSDPKRQYRVAASDLTCCIHS